MNPRVSAIILNWNGVAHLTDCLETLLKQDYDSLDIIVADNGSTDASAEVVARYPGVRWEPLGKNHGFALGNNLGARPATGEYLFFLNNDMRFPPDLVSRMVEVAQRDASIFSLDCRQLSWDGREVVHSALRLQRRPDLQGSFLPGIDAVQQELPGVVPVPFACGSTFFCRRSMFEALGGFDPTFFIDGEDLDLGWRGWMRGWSTYYVADAYCWHKVGRADDAWKARGKLSEWQRKRLLSGLTNKARFVMKTQRTSTILRTALSYHLDAARSLMRGHFYGAWARFAGWWAPLAAPLDLRRARAYAGGARATEAVLDRFLAGGEVD